jgi:hypothetical protein
MPLRRKTKQRRSQKQKQKQHQNIKININNGSSKQNDQPRLVYQQLQSSSQPIYIPFPTVSYPTVNPIQEKPSVKDIINQPIPNPIYNTLDEPINDLRRIKIPNKQDTSKILNNKESHPEKNLDYTLNKSNDDETYFGNLYDEPVKPSKSNDEVVNSLLDKAEASNNNNQARSALITRGNGGKTGSGNRINISEESIKKYNIKIDEDGFYY